MRKYWKLLDWIIGGIVTIFFLWGPVWFAGHNYISPYKIPLRVVGVFLIYCFLSGIYWLINKKINMVFHYCLIVAIYIAISITMIIVAASNG